MRQFPLLESIMRIERHDIRRKSGFLPVPLTNPRYWPLERLALLEPVYEDGVLKGYNGSVLTDILWAEMQGDLYYGRMDIILINEKVPCTCHCGHKHEDTIQHVVCPGPEGTLVGDVSILSPEDLAWALEESAKCWAVPELRRCIR